MYHYGKMFKKYLGKKKQVAEEYIWYDSICVCVFLKVYKQIYIQKIFQRLFKIPLTFYNIIRKAKSLLI